MSQLPGSLRDSALPSSGVPRPSCHNPAGGGVVQDGNVSDQGLNACNSQRYIPSSRPGTRPAARPRRRPRGRRDAAHGGHGGLAARLKDKQLTRLRRSAIGFVFQSFNLLPTLTAAENIELPLRIAGRRLDRDWLDGIVCTLGLGDRLRHRPSELSGGQQQRVAIARALVTHPVVVFADEPTGNLDSRAGQELLGLLRHSVTELGQTIVMVTHDPVAASHADGVLFLADGRLAGELEKPTVSAVLDRLGGLEEGR